MAVTERGRFANSYDFLVAVAAFAVGPFVLRLPYTIFVFGGACKPVVVFVINLLQDCGIASVAINQKIDNNRKMINFRASKFCIVQ